MLLAELEGENRRHLAVWLGIGLVIYFVYSRKRTVMAHLQHELSAHGVSPRGQTVGDPDAPPDRPVDPKVK